MRLITVTVGLLIVAYTVFDKLDDRFGKDLPEEFTDAIPSEPAVKY